MDASSASANYDFFTTDACIAVVRTSNTRTWIRTLEPKRIVEIATIGGAAALQLDKEIGSLTPGKRADIILVQKTDINMVPVIDPYYSLVYSGGPGNMQNRHHRRQYRHPRRDAFDSRCFRGSQGGRPSGQRDAREAGANHRKRPGGQRELQTGKADGVARTGRSAGRWVIKTVPRLGSDSIAPWFIAEIMERNTMTSRVFHIGKSALVLPLHGSGKHRGRTGGWKRAHLQPSRHPRGRLPCERRSVCSEGLPCSRLGTRLELARIVSTKFLAAADGVPEHCRIDDVIPNPCPCHALIEPRQTLARCHECSAEFSRRL